MYKSLNTLHTLEDELRVATLSFIYNFISLGENLTILFFTESKWMHFLSQALRPPSNFSQHNQPIVLLNIFDRLFEEFKLLIDFSDEIKIGIFFS